LTLPRFTPRHIERTDEQAAIQGTTAKFIIVEANAGAAKTTTLALRIAESLDFGTPPEKILALTYTEPACDALRAALKKIGVRFELARRVRIGTFESFAIAVLKRLEGGIVPSLLTEEALRPHVLQAFDNVASNTEERWPEDLVFPGAGDALVIDFLQQSLQLKGTMQLETELEGGITPESADSLGRNYALLKAFRSFENARRRGGDDHPLFRAPADATYDLACLIHNDLLEAGAPGWPTDVRTVVVDEMHDMNQSMYVLLNHILITNSQAFFCGAGDRDQVIHQTAGADVRFMADALGNEGRRKLTRFPLTASYRFGPTLARHMGRFAAKPYASFANHPTVVSAWGYASDAACDTLIMKAIREHAEAGHKMSELAVLLRHPYQSVSLENALLQAAVPYTVSGFDSYLLRPEILLVRGLLAVATNDFAHVAEPDTRRRIIEAFVLFGNVNIQVGRNEDTDQTALLAEASRAVEENPDILPTFFENQVLRNAAPDVKRRLEAAVAEAQKPGHAVLERLLAALQLRTLASRVMVGAAPLRALAHHLEGLQRSAASHTSADAFFKSLNEAEQRQRELRRSDSLRLSSIEAVKGLEFDHVVIPHLARSVFPDAAATDSDENHLFYVGATRARHRLTLCVSASAPSPFVEACGLSVTTQ
jgi:DNA helicase-2/ATP-dependent DNA helicase PcrA